MAVLLRTSVRFSGRTAFKNYPSILLKILSENPFSGKTYFYTIASRNNELPTVGGLAPAQMMQPQQNDFHDRHGDHRGGGGGMGGMGDVGGRRQHEWGGPKGGGGGGLGPRDGYMNGGGRGGGGGPGGDMSNNTWSSSSPTQGPIV